MSADLMRETAALMREQHGPDHPRHEMWVAMADWLEVTASDVGSSTLAYKAALAVANAYPREDQ